MVTASAARGQRWLLKSTAEMKGAVCVLSGQEGGLAPALRHLTSSG